MHYRPSQIGDVQTEPPAHGGLSRFGREVVAECNRLGIVVDRAHASLDTTMDVLEASDQPVIISHGRLGHPGVARPRLLTTAHAAAVASAGGLIGAWPAGEGPAGAERPADPRPQGRELPRRTERQAVPGVDQVRARQVRRSERRGQNADPSGSGGRDARPEQREPGWLGVDRQDQPAASEQFQRIGALAAAQVDRQAVLAGP